MFKKIIIFILLITVFGAGGAALAYNAARQENITAAEKSDLLATGGESAGQQHGGQGIQARDSESDAASLDAQGEPWQASGTITALDDVGFDFDTDNGESVYIELGPPDYWQSLDVTLEVGQIVSVTGSINEDMIHAAQVILEDGQVLAIRTDSGQPLWSGGADESRGQNAGHTEGEPNPEPQVNVDEWVTIQGTLMSFQGNNITMGTAEGDLITFQTGQPRFFVSQGITFQVGDVIEVLGYDQGGQFMAGDITQLSTGLRVMLRDPNGRPLWAGPGNGNGSTGNDNGRGNGNRRGAGNF